MKTNSSLLWFCVLGLLLSSHPSGFAAEDEVETQGWRQGRDRDRDDRRGRHRAPRVVLYERPDFRGASLELELDEAVTDLRELRFPNGSRVDNKISSIHVERGAQIRIYEADMFEGEFLDLTRSVPDLTAMARAGNRSWGNAISSLRVFENRYPRQRWRDPSRQPRVIVFSRENFQGQAFEIYPGESLDDLGRERFDDGVDLNKEIASIRVVGPIKLRLYADKRLRGESVEITSDVADLDRVRRANPRKDWKNYAKSLQVEWVGSQPRFEPEPADDIEGPTPAPSPAPGPRPPGQDPRDVIRPDDPRKPSSGDKDADDKKAGEF
jgi:hypothetical protein